MMLAMTRVTQVKAKREMPRLAGSRQTILRMHIRVCKGLAGSKRHSELCRLVFAPVREILILIFRGPRARQCPAEARFCGHDWARVLLLEPDCREE
jgi:hypothetical protein